MNTPDSRPVFFLQYEEDKSQRVEGEVVAEAPIVIRIKSGRTWRVMANPKQLRELAVGLLFAEGVPDPIGAIDSIEIDALLSQQGPDELLDPTPDSGTTRGMGPCTETLIDTSGFRATRNGPGNSSSSEDASPRRTPHRLGETIHFSPAAIYDAMDAMNALQDLRDRTRGTHAMALIDSEGAIVAFAEDVGRHNALDKVIGHCMLEGRPTQGLAAIMSSRVSHEMAMKAIRAGIEICAAVSAPSSLALDAAERFGLTVACFVQDRGLTIFTHPERVS